MRELTSTFCILAVALLAACSSPPAVNEPKLSFHCSLDESCPEVLVQGDPHATLDGAPAPFRGYGDPSLEVAQDGTLWLAYSWLDTIVSQPGPPPQIDFGVRTHLAKSDDGGATFTFVTELNAVDPEVHPETLEEGWIQREVPTLLLDASGGWQLWHLDYFDPWGEGPDNRSDFHLSRATSQTPSGLSAVSRPVIRATVTTPAIGGDLAIDEIDGMQRCVVPTEPGLLSYAGADWLAVHCLVVSRLGSRQVEREEISLLRLDDDGPTYMGALLTPADAHQLDADVLTQPDLYVGRDGSVQLLATPKNLGAAVQHQGCVAYAIEDLSTASVTRDEAGTPVQLARITADGTGLGPGLCTYDAASETGVLLVITDIDLSIEPPKILFSLRRTGVHP